MPVWAAMLRGARHLCQALKPDSQQSVPSCTTWGPTKVKGRAYLPRRPCKACHKRRRQRVNEECPLLSLQPWVFPPLKPVLETAPLRRPELLCADLGSLETLEDFAKRTHKMYCMGPPSACKCPFPTQVLAHPMLETLTFCGSMHALSTRPLALHMPLECQADPCQENEAEQEERLV